MLSRLIPKSSHFRRFVLFPTKTLPYPQSNFTYLATTSHLGTFSKYFSTNGGDNNNKKDPSNFGFWKDSGSFARFNDRDDGTKAPASKDQWWLEEKGLDNQDESSIFKEDDNKTQKVGGFGDQQWMGAEEIKPWTLQDDGKEDVFIEGFGEHVGELRSGEIPVEGEKAEDPEKLEKEEQALTTVLKGKLNCLLCLITRLS